MTRNTLLVLLTLTIFGAIACTDSNGDTALKAREEALLLRESSFASKEADYQSLIKMRDSLFKKKTAPVVQTWPAGTEGYWDSKTICRESDCGDYVVGDQRADSWQFSSDSSGVFTKVFNNGKLTRIYSAVADSTEFRLSYQTDSSATRKVNMQVVLRPVSPNLIKGTQKIIVNDNCTATFSVELVRASKL